MKMCLAALKPASLTFNHISNSCYNLNDMSVHLYYSTFTLLFFFFKKKKQHLFLAFIFVSVVIFLFCEQAESVIILCLISECA